jgi:hypothetical protein
MGCYTGRPSRYAVRLAAAALFAIVTVPSATAQQFAYVAAPKPSSFCADQSATCTPAQVLVINTATATTEAAVLLPTLSQQVEQLLVHPDGQRLYAILNGCAVPGPTGPNVGCPGISIVHVIDTRTFATLASITLNGAWGGCALSPDGARLVCGLGAEVDVIDTADNEVLAHLSTVPTAFPTSVAFSPNGRQFYVAQTNDRIVVHDSDSYATVATIPLGGRAEALTMTHDGARLYASLGGRSVAEIDVASNTVLRAIDNVASGSNQIRSIAIAQGRAYVAADGPALGQGALTVIDLASGTITRTIPVGNPRQVAASLDQAHVYLSRPGAIDRIDTGTGAVGASTLLPSMASAGIPLALSPPSPGPRLFVDVPLSGATLTQPFAVGGWAVDVFGTAGAPGVDAVHVWAFPATGGNAIFVGAAEYGRARPDVAALLGTAYLDSGYQMSVSGLTPGLYTLTVFAHSSRTGTFTVTRQVPVTIASGAVNAPPFGSFDTPASGATMAGEVAVTGWALDDSGIAGVDIYRSPAAGEPTQPNGLVFLGTATQVAGARPDIVTAHSGYPGVASAGWGYMLLSNMLPNQGNGVVTLHVYVRTVDGANVLLGTRTVIAANAAATAPFGTIDTPRQGETVSGMVTNFGWALAPQPNVIATDGSTISVYIDGTLRGRPTYSQFRGDIFSLFPGYANSSGAAGFFVFDSTTLANGVHTISWGVTDNAGHTSGIGSRYFTVANGVSSGASSQMDPTASGIAR